MPVNLKNKLRIIKKYLFTTAIACVFLVPQSINAANIPLKNINSIHEYRNLPVMYYTIDEKDINESKNDIEITGSIPVVIMRDKIFENKLNGLIVQAYNDIISQAGDRQVKISFSYEEIVDGEYISILLKSGSTQNMPNKAEQPVDIIRSFNFSTSTNELVDINSILGPNGINLVNKVISEEIKSNIDIYNPNFAGITPSHDFYIQENIMYVIFDRYEIALGHIGTVGFPIHLDKIIELSIDNSEYKIRPGFNIRMVMLKQVTDAFDMILGWDEKTSTVDVFSKDNKLLAKLVIGKNAYTRNKPSSVASLEAPPEIIEGRTHVPISFFDEFLGIPYSVNADGTIIFSEYIK